MADQRIESRPIDARRNLLDALEFLANRGATPDMIRLAMERAGISAEVARVLSQCVVTTAPQSLPAPLPAIPDTGKAASRALRKLAGFVLTVVFLWGAGLALGFAVGMELGLAQGLESGLDAVHRLVRL